MTTGTRDTGTTMANKADDSDKQITDSRATYDAFLAASKWGVIFVALTLILMAVFFVH